MNAEIRNVDELRPVLEKEIASLKDELTADIVTLHLYDPERTRLYFPVGVGLIQPERFMGGIPSMERVGGNIVRHRKRIIAEDAEHHPDITGPFTYAERAKSAAGFPLITDPDSEDVFGILFVDYRNPHAFTDDEINVIEKRAAKIAGLLQRNLEGAQGRELEDALRRRDDLRLEELRLREIVDRLWEILGDVDVALWTREQGKRDLTIKACKGLDQEFAHHVAVNLDKDHGHFIAVAYTERSDIDIANPPSDSRVFFNVEWPIAWDRILAVPVATETQLVGILCVCRRERGEFTRQERDLIKAFAELLAVTIENENRIVALNALHDVGVRLTLATKLEDILQQVVHSACLVIGADTATVHLYDPIKQEFHDLDRAAVFPPEAKADMEKPRSKGGLSARIIDQGRVYCENVEEQADIKVLSTFVKEQNVRAYVGTRLTSIDEHLGVLYVSFHEPRQFPPQDLALIQVLANYASTAIYRTQLLKQRATVADIAREITSVRNPSDLLQQTLRRSLELLNCEYGSISVFDPETNKLYFTYAVGKDPQMSVALGEGLIGAAAASRKPVRVADVSKDDRYVPHIGDTQSEMDVPMLIGDRLVGVLNAESSRLKAFSEEDEQLAVTLAAQAAVAFQTAELYEEAQTLLDRRVADIQAIEKIYSLIGVAQMKEVLEEICEEAARLTPAKYTGIWLTNYDARELRFGARNERDVDPVARLERISFDEPSINVRVALSGETFLANDVSTVDFFKPWFEGVQSELTVPLRIGERIIGTLNLEATEIGAFTKDHVRLVETLSGAAAVAIESARHYERLDALARIGQIATSTLGLKDVLSRILHESLEILGANYGTLRLLNRAEGTLELFAHEGEMAVLTPKPISLEEGVVGWVATHNESLLVPDTSVDERHLPTVKDTRSELAVPIQIEGRVLGVLNIEHPQPHAFDEHDRSLLESIASHAATAVRNAKLYQARQIVSQVGQKLTGGIRMRTDQIVKLIHAQASKLMDTGNMYIALYDETTDVVRFGLAYVEGKRINVKRAKKWGPRQGGTGRTEWIIRHHKPIFITTKDEAEKWYALPGHKEYVGKALVSWIGVPMIVGQKVLGVIATYHPEKEYVYSKDDLDILQAMADQAAIALDNADLFYNVNRKMVALTKFQQALASNIRLEEDEIVRLIHVQASELMDTKNMYIALYNEKTDTVRFPLAFKDGNPLTIETRSGGKGRTEWIIRHRKPILIYTQAESEAWYQQPEHQEYVGEITSSWIGVPMMLGNTVLGVIATYREKEEYLYTGNDLEILQTMADQAAIAFENARLLQRERQRSAELNLLYQVGQKVSSTLDVDEILSSILQEAIELTGAINGVVHLLKSSGEFERSYRYPPQSHHPEPRLTQEGSMTHTILKTGEPLIVPDAGHSPYVSEKMIHSGVKSIVGVPLMLRGHVIGVLYLNATEPHVFTEEALALLNALADQAAIAIENARLYEEARGEVQAIRQLSTLGIAIAALQHRINNTFNIIVPNVARLRKRLGTSDPVIVDILDIVDRNARYTSEIIERIQEPLRETESQKVDINAVLADVARNVKQPSIEVNLALDDSVPVFNAPIGQVTEIFQNLVDNACRVMNEGGQLTINSALLKGNIFIRIQDTGPGIPIKIQERLFVKPVPSKEPGGGAGLGLWLSSLMLQAFGGNIKIQETGPAGTTMLVTIPVSAIG